MNDVTVTTRVGLIDDDVSVRRAIGRLLRAHGYSCATYQSAEEALAEPGFLQLSCIVVDIQLGGINGFELCDRIDAIGVRLPRVFITAHERSDLPGYSDKLGNDSLLTKPFEEKQLIESIENAISRSS